MAWTQADLDRVKNALATGARSIQFVDGMRIDHFTPAELRRIQHTIEVALGLTQKGRVFSLSRHSKGIGGGSFGGRASEV